LSGKGGSLRFLKELKRSVRLTGVDEIARRYFVMNLFDGSLAMLGVVLGSYAAGVDSALVVVKVALGVGLAMAVSGFSGAYIAEKAERLRELREVERAVFSKLGDTALARASSLAVLLAAAVNGASPLLAIVLALTPFALSTLGLLSFNMAVASSATAIILALFAIGAYMGRVSGEGLLISGARALIIGGATVVLLLLIQAM